MATAADDATAAEASFSERERRFERWRNTIGFFLGPLGCLLVWWLPMGGLDLRAHRLAAIVTLVVVWWVTEPIPIPATALIGAACFTVNGMVEKFGGTAGNIAYTLSLLNERPVLIATIGKDYEGYFDWLKKNNISEEGIKIVREEFTAGAYKITDKADNQITGFNPGAMKYPSGYTFHNADSINSISLIAPGNLQDMVEYAIICKKKGIDYICDPGQSLTQWKGKPSGSCLMVQCC